MHPLGDWRLLQMVVAFGVTPGFGAWALFLTPMRGLCGCGPVPQDVAEYYEAVANGAWIGA